MKLSEMNKKLNTYYIVVEEWNYPYESGREIVSDYDTIDEALSVCKEYCEKEEYNFFESTKEDTLHTTVFRTDDDKIGGYIISSKNGLEGWYYATRILEVEILN